MCTFLYLARSRLNLEIRIAQNYKKRVAGMGIVTTTSFALSKFAAMKQKKKEKRMVELSLWDFAGQDVYFTTHQFFLSSRAVYMLVFSLVKRDTEKRLEFWLESLKVRNNLIFQLFIFPVSFGCFFFHV